MTGPQLADPPLKFVEFAAVPSAWLDTCACVYSQGVYWYTIAMTIRASYQ